MGFLARWVKLANLAAVQCPHDSDPRDHCRTIELIGHPGKDENRGHHGSNAHMGDVDLMVQIKGDGLVKSASIIKISNGQEAPLTHYKIEVAVLGTDDDGEGRANRC
ncbi:hypothetical protein [Bradyrhizobium sp. sBnM-33]|uniref:hypothetical protein n=1 Tax=Bradyrhizobium sp. sBnM-33 TaxID=2831780 RepID=UPI001BCCDCD4|nr:hypothetical protein [Bradyrhizobium sp. sBnM-33]WOH53763.1 hypothetical protein RX328_17735 [Bradyrhizobium sp. sBnM-33]